MDIAKCALAILDFECKSENELTENGTVAQCRQEWKQICVLII